MYKRTGIKMRRWGLRKPWLPRPREGVSLLAHCSMRLSQSCHSLETARGQVPTLRSKASHWPQSQDELHAPFANK